jgi:hypothetical protein
LGVELRIVLVGLRERRLDGLGAGDASGCEPHENKCDRNF